MQFIKANQESAVLAIASRILSELASNRRVLWLVSGGSNVALEVEIMSILRWRAGQSLQRVCILPMDERYGMPGHGDSNSQALRDAGFLPGPARWIDVLAGNEPMEYTISTYTKVFADALAEASVVIGQFGLGSDGHIAGILPDSPACTEDVASVLGYQWHDYTRLSLTPLALRQISTAYVPAYGSNKQRALERLQNNTESVAKLPAKLLYNIPEVYVYNSHIESEE